MTSIRLMKRRHKNVLSRFMDEKFRKVAYVFDGDLVRITAVVGSRRKCRIILTRSYLRRILEVQKTRKNKTEKGGER
ncbi:hypothetical protein [uncultured Prevotella sp.]|uniref:hypothetical protein n=1 Tax=uncultured Prevotella sp. TaxID=159272 RepID=UPI00260E7C59|nr:hypothetical protein [uncultured Prevotella sp.]